MTMKRNIIHTLWAAALLLTALTTVTCQATEVPDLGEDAFYGCTNLTAINVPAGSVGTYKTATGWSDYADIIQPIP